MFHFLGFLFIIIIAILLIGLSIIGTVIRSIFGLGDKGNPYFIDFQGGSRRSSNTYRNENGNYQSGRGYSFNGRQQSGSSSNEEPKTRIKEETAHGRHKKLFSQDEGEYVDFEEIKEE